MTQQDSPADLASELQSWLDAAGQLPPAVHQLLEAEIRRLRSGAVLASQFERESLADAAAQLIEARREIDALLRVRERARDLAGAIDMAQAQLVARGDGIVMVPVSSWDALMEKRGALELKP